MLIVGGRDCPRVANLQCALQAAGQPAAQVVEYPEVVAGRLANLDLDGRVLRLESPGRDPAVFAEFLRQGIAGMEAQGRVPQLGIGDYQNGEIVQPRQWYLGFCRILEMIGLQIRQATGVRMLSSLAEIPVLFSKSATQARLAAAGVPVPARLGRIGCFDELLAEMGQQRRQRFFVKLDHGSSASGMLALARQGDGWLAHSTIELVEKNGQTKLYNSRKIQCFRDPATIAKIVNRLCEFSAHAETWVPKIAFAGGTCDLRMITTEGEPTHSMLRKSKGPFTNLHLQNKRESVDGLRRCVGEAPWRQVLATAKAAAACFPQSFALGIDVALAINLKPYVLEVNAFGDFVRGCTVDGLDPQAAQLRRLQAT